MTSDEQYAWDLVSAAARLPAPSLPFAAHLLAVPPLNRLPADTRARLHGLLHSLGYVERTPAVEAFLLALSQGGSAADVQQSPQWHTLRLLQQERHALAALVFMHSVAEAGLRRAAADPI